MRGTRKLFSDTAVRRLVTQVESNPTLTSAEHLLAMQELMPEEFSHRTLQQIRSLLGSDRVGEFFGYEQRDRLRLSMKEADRALRESQKERGEYSIPPEKRPLDLSRFSPLARKLAISSQPPEEDRWKRLRAIMEGSRLSLESPLGA